MCNVQGHRDGQRNLASLSPSLYSRASITSSSLLKHAMIAPRSTHRSKGGPNSHRGTIHMVFILLLYGSQWGNQWVTNVDQWGYNGEGMGNGEPIWGQHGEPPVTSYSQLIENPLQTYCARQTPVFLPRLLETRVPRVFPSERLPLRLFFIK